MATDDNKETELLLSALEFFVDYKFKTGSGMQQRYLEIIAETNHNDYAKLCKKLGGKPTFEPTLD